MSWQNKKYINSIVRVCAFVTFKDQPQIMPEAARHSRAFLQDLKQSNKVFYLQLFQCVFENGNGRWWGWGEGLLPYSV